MKRRKVTKAHLDWITKTSDLEMGHSGSLPQFNFGNCSSVFPCA